MKVTRWASKEGLDPIEETSDDVQPSESQMDVAKKLLGSGEARVSAGVDLAFKDFGDGYGVHVNVSLNCSQTDKGIGETLELAKEISHSAAEMHMEEAAALFEYMGKKK
jgi:hypothetical protein